MNEFSFLPVAYATAEEVTGSAAEERAEKAGTAEAITEVPEKAHEAQGLSVQPIVVLEQAFNLLILLAALYFILYKPLLKMMGEREQKIKDGVENADKAQKMLNEATSTQSEMIKKANMEGQQIMEKARKSGEELKSGILLEAHNQADHIIKAGHQSVEMEKSKTLQELKGKAVSIVVKATEKILKEKLDSQKDAKFIDESLNSLSV